MAGLQKKGPKRKTAKARRQHADHLREVVDVDAYAAHLQAAERYAEHEDAQDYPTPPPETRPASSAHPRRRPGTHARYLVDPLSREDLAALVRLALPEVAVLPEHHAHAQAADRDLVRYLTSGRAGGRDRAREHLRTVARAYSTTAPDAVVSNLLEAGRIRRTLVALRISNEHAA
jgi:hypothetical protein